MSKKNKSSQQDGELASEGILDSLAGGGDQAGEAEPVVPPASDAPVGGLKLGKGEKSDGGKVSTEKAADKAKPELGKKGDKAAAKPELGKKADKKPAEPQGEKSDDDAPGSVRPPDFNPWPVDPTNRSAANVLLSPAADRTVDGALDDDMKPRGAGLNFMLILLILGVAAGGVWQFVKISSPEALAAKKAEKEQIEQQHLAEQLAKQKKYGVLRIESNPPQAELWLNGERKVNKNETTGEEVVVKTPTNLMDLDIGQTYQIRLEAPGYEPYEFNVAEHLWTKDAGSGEFKFFTLAEMTPNVCEYWFLYDAKLKKEQQFKEKSDCLTHFEDAVSKQVSVTECTCKIPPEGVVVPGAKDEKKDEKKDPKGSK